MDAPDATNVTGTRGGTGVAGVTVRSSAGLEGDVLFFGQGGNESLIVNSENSFSLNGANTGNLASSFEFEDLILDFSDAVNERGAVLSGFPAEFEDFPAAGENDVFSILVEAMAENSTSLIDTEFTYDMWGGNEAEGALLLTQQEILSITGN